MRESFLTDDFLLRLCDHSLFYILLLRLHSRTSAHVCLLELDYDLQETVFLGVSCYCYLPSSRGTTLEDVYDL